MEAGHVFIIILILIAIAIIIDMCKKDLRVRRSEADLINSSRALLLQCDKKNHLGLYDEEILADHPSVVDIGYTRTPKMGYSVGTSYSFPGDCFVFGISNGDYKTECVIRRSRFLSQEFRNNLEGFLLELEKRFDNIIDDLDVE